MKTELKNLSKTRITLKIGALSDRVGRMVRLAVFLFAIATGVSAGPAVALPVRIALPSLDRAVSPTPASIFHCALGLHLRERLDEMPSFLLVSDNRLEAILRALASPAVSMKPGDLPDAFRAVQPVEVFIQFEYRPGTGLRLMVDTPDKKSDTEIEFGEVDSFRDRIMRAVRLIGETLALSQDQMDRLMEDRIGGNDADFEAYYASQAWPTPAVRPGHRGMEFGDMRLHRLHQRWEANRDNPRFARLVFISAWEQSVSQADYDFRRVDWAWMSSEFLEAILGSEFEPDAYPLIVSRPNLFAEMLYDLTKPFADTVGDPLDITGLLGIDDIAPPSARGAGLVGELDLMTSQARPEQRRINVETRLGALRALGLMNQPKALSVLKDAAGHHDERVRAAAAAGLGVYTNRAGVDTLRKMLDDPDLIVAWQADYGLWKNGRPSSRFAERARRMALTDFNGRTDAVRALAAIAQPEDTDILRRLWNERLPGTRRELIEARLRLNDVAEWTALFRDPDHQVLLTVMTQADAVRTTPDVADEIRRLTDDPYGPVARAARNLMLPSRPTAAGVEQSRYDLAYEEPYLRLRALERLAGLDSPEALDALEAACANSDPQTRAEALMLLGERAPGRARPIVIDALGDRHRWVALHAAVMAADLADDGFVPALRKRLAVVTEPAERLYLERALARAGAGEDPAAPLPAARSIAGRRNLAWNTSPASQSDVSPFDAYYSMKVRADRDMRLAYAAGKIIFGRATPIASPGLIMVNRESSDAFWLALEEQLTLDDLAVLDGVIYGEESMNVTPDRLWNDGWRSFCLEAGLDPHRVNGEIDRLNRIERHAWTTWAGSRHIEGFNRLYDFTKRKYGQLRPGIQVGSFLPAEGLWSRQSPDALLEWKFDLGGVYDYKGDNRLAGYSLIRRYKTLWPDRPVLWLSLGIGGYEMNPVRHTQRVPETPMLDRYNRAYNDALTAWMAGADTGWFSTWMFVSPDFKRAGMARLRGVHLWVEDLGPDTSLLERAIAYSFRGVEQIELDKLLPDAPEMPTASVEMVREPIRDLFQELEEQDLAEEQQAEISEEVRERRQRFKEGFLFYQRYVYDSARIFASLPRVDIRPQALVVRHGVTVWTRPRRPYPLIPGEGLLQEFDFLCDVNMLPNIDLDRYRYLVVHRPEALRDSTIERLTRWLRETPGLLIVHLDLTTDNNAKDGTVDDLSGPLLNDWPWENDIDRLTGHDGKPLPVADRLTDLTLTTSSGSLDVRELTLETRWNIMSERARPLIQRGDETLLSVWRDPENFKGAVIFDGVREASIEYLNALRAAVNDLADAGIGLRLDPPAAMEVLRFDSVQAAAGSHYYRTVRDELTLEGIEVMTGELDPEVGGPRNRRSALVLRDYVGRFVAATGSLTAVSDDPFIKAEIDGHDLVLHAPGVIRAASVSGNIAVITPSNRLLKEVDDPVAWLLHSDEEGIARIRRGVEGPWMTYIRCREPVRLQPAAVPPAL